MPFLELSLLIFCALQTATASPHKSGVGLFHRTWSEFFPLVSWVNFRFDRIMTEKGPAELSLCWNRTSLTATNVETE